ncbi:hypothetical protein EDB81DRAFT_899042 [Dactylonectria macrodidyma]|uniref:Uncharacterized protein n=1 Tax=Dactylonectria macrodidyma TaxID=307937 RepID=A0A9P9EQI9_9HYPO|nr:hypothetical protein EDB81DRAFT_899042 [Dactylonectria macrodidyma]
MHHQETQNGYFAIDAAVAEQTEGDFKHFVSINSQRLKPKSASNSTWANQEKPVLKLPYDHRIPNSHIFLKDLAEASVKAIREREEHFHSQYPLSSTFPITYQDVADRVGDLLGKKIEIVKTPYEESVQRLVTAQFGQRYNAWNLNVAERLVLWYERYGLNGSPNVLKWLLGRNPITIEEWMAKSAS